MAFCPRLSHSIQRALRESYSILLRHFYFKTTGLALGSHLVLVLGQGWRLLLPVKQLWGRKKWVEREVWGSMLGASGTVPRVALPLPTPPPHCWDSVPPPAHQWEWSHCAPHRREGDGSDSRSVGDWCWPHIFFLGARNVCVVHTLKMGFSTSYAVSDQNLVPRFIHIYTYSESLRKSFPVFKRFILIMLLKFCLSLHRNTHTHTHSII